MWEYKNVQMSKFCTPTFAHYSQINKIKKMNFKTNKEQI